MLKKFRAPECSEFITWMHSSNPRRHWLLNLGCGEDTDHRYDFESKGGILRHEQYINCDIVKSKNVHILLDLDRPLPFKDECIDKIVLMMVMGHIEHPIKLKKELNRILREHGEVIITGCSCKSSHKQNYDATYMKCKDEVEK